MSDVEQMSAIGGDHGLTRADEAGVALEHPGSNASKITALSPAGAVQWTRDYCSACTLAPGEWALGKQGTLLFPAYSVAIPGSFTVRQQ